MVVALARFSTGTWCVWQVIIRDLFEFYTHLVSSNPATEVIRKLLTEAVEVTIPGTFTPHKVLLFILLSWEATSASEAISPSNSPVKSGSLAEDTYPV